MKMKELKLMFKSLVLLALGLIVSQRADAWSTFGYNVSVTTDGNGTVYYSRTQQTIGDDGIVAGATYQNSFNNSRFTVDESYNAATSSSTVYVYAKPNTGYIFNGWTSASQGVAFQFPNTQNTSVNLTANAGDARTRNLFQSQKYQSFTLRANFVQDNGYVKVESAQPNWGVVEISSVQNHIGDQVTIKAVPMISLQGVKFDHWTKIPDGGSEEIVEGGTAEMTVTATSTKTIYRAYFTPPVETQGVFCRIKNKETGGYLYMYGTEKANFQKQGSGNNQVVYSVVNGLKITSDVVSNASTIFFLSGVNDGAQGLEQCHLQAQGVNTHETITTNLGDVSVIFTSQGYRIAVFYIDDGKSMQLNLTTSNGNLRFASDDSNNALWEIEIIDEDSMDEYYFGMAPKSYFTKTHNGEQKYYTTLYTSFGYKLMDGVNAYYIDKDNVEENIRNGRVYLSEIPAGSTILGKRAVILECSTPGDAKANRLLPVSTDVDPDAAYWPLQGYIKLNGEAIFPSAYEDEGHEFYVLSVNSDHEKLGFYQYSKELSSNKAFAVVPSEYVNDARAAKVIWYGDETDNVNNIEFIFPEKEQYYDLQGRKVENPQKGIYIVNGRKVIK